MVGRGGVGGGVEVSLRLAVSDEYDSLWENVFGRRLRWWWM